jgi:hypothetical protein
MTGCCDKVLDVVEHLGGHGKVKAARFEVELFESLVAHGSRAEPAPRPVDHRCRSVDPGVAGAASVAERRPQPAVAAAEVEHRQPADVADRPPQRRQLHGLDR